MYEKVSMKLFVKLIFCAAIIILHFSCQPGRLRNLLLRPDYRKAMRSFVRQISSKAKNQKPGFIVIAQNGLELLTDNGTANGIPDQSYLNALDGVGQEGVFFGYEFENGETPGPIRDHLSAYLNISHLIGKQKLVIDYCSTSSDMDESYLLNDLYGFLSFATDKRKLNTIPLHSSKPFNVNSENISEIIQARNFLFILSYELFDRRSDFLQTLRHTDYDLLIIDLFYNDGIAFTPEEVQSLKTKNNGGSRLVLCYLSIGEAENYRYYWHKSWEKNAPRWLEKENPKWPGNYKVKYWNKNWQSIITGNADSYLQKIINSKFDGVYLDIIDAFQYFEQNYQNSAK